MPDTSRTKSKPLLPRSIVTPPLMLESVQKFGTSFVQLRYLVQRSQ